MESASTHTLVSSYVIAEQGDGKYFDTALTLEGVAKSLQGLLNERGLTEHYTVEKGNYGVTVSRVGCYAGTINVTTGKHPGYSFRSDATRSGLILVAVTGLAYNSKERFRVTPANPDRMLKVLSEALDALIKWVDSAVQQEESRIKRKSVVQSFAEAVGLKAHNDGLGVYGSLYENGRYLSVSGSVSSERADLKLSGLTVEEAEKIIALLGFFPERLAAEVKEETEKATKQF